MPGRRDDRLRPEQTGAGADHIEAILDAGGNAPFGLGHQVGNQRLEIGLGDVGRQLHEHIRDEQQGKGTGHAE